MDYPRGADDSERIRRVISLRLMADPDQVLDRICELARKLLSVPIALISVLDETHQHFPNQCGLATDQTSRDVAFCNYTIAQARPLIVPDALNDARFRDNPLVTAAPFIRFYAGMPLSLESGGPVATLCCIDTTPRRLSATQRDVLADLALLAGSQLRLREANLTLAWNSEHDWLTGLENRRGFQGRLDKTLADASEAGRFVGLLTIDMDGFKQVNDTEGHESGDALLKSASRVLRDRVPAGTVPARTGGDEFTVLVPDLEGGSEAEALGFELVSALRDLAGAGGLRTNSRASIGISLYPDHASNATALLKAADLALYAAKESGGDRIALYSPDLTSRMQRHVSMLDRARDALSNSEITPFYQPKIALSTGRVTGFEALLRLRGPNGLETPASVEAAFADSHLSVQIGVEMLTCIIEDMRTWQEAGLAFGSVAFNVTEFDLCADLSSCLLDRLKKAGLPPSALQVEVTENVFLGRKAENAKRVLQDLRAGGIEVALDDFGTGFASLSHLREFPVDWLKLDRSFVSDMDADQRAAAIVHGVISIAQSLGIGVIAEGLESRHHLHLLQRRRCDLGQGYLFARPMAGSRVPHFLRTWSGIPEELVATDTLRAAS